MALNFIHHQMSQNLDPRPFCTRLYGKNQGLSDSRALHQWENSWPQHFGMKCDCNGMLLPARTPREHRSHIKKIENSRSGGPSHNRNSTVLVDPAQGKEAPIRLGRKEIYGLHYVHYFNRIKVSMASQQFCLADRNQSHVAVVQDADRLVETASVV
jgi:hypothetical protein